MSCPARASRLTQRKLELWPTPENLTELQSFLGLARYYRRSIIDFSIDEEPLYRLNKKGVKFQWGPERLRAFDELKHRLTSAPMLATQTSHQVQGPLYWTLMPASNWESGLCFHKSNLMEPRGQWPMVAVL